MIDENDEWFVRNADWDHSDQFGYRCRFESPTDRWPSTGVALWVLEPGKPGCLYHRENAQEDFLVLSGECVLLVNGEERRLRAWDFVHCPPGVSHVFIGAGDGPCVVVMIGDRPSDHRVFYPASHVASRHGAESSVPTDDPRQAYADTQRPAPCDAPSWPLTPPTS